MIKISLEGSEELGRALANMSDEIRHEMSELVMEMAAGIHAGVVLRMQQGPHTGRTYRRGNVIHQASAPGEAPAPDTGELIGSIYHERESELSAVAGSRSKKSLWLEYGTTKMAPRPAWTPEAEEAAPEFRAEAARILGVVTK